jgi:hypothetical protein
MQGLALATLFVGLALIDPGHNVDARAAMVAFRGTVFFVAAVVILVGH